MSGAMFDSVLTVTTIGAAWLGEPGATGESGDIRGDGPIRRKHGDVMLAVSHDLEWREARVLEGIDNAGDRQGLVAFLRRQECERFREHDRLRSRVVLWPGCSGGARAGSAGAGRGSWLPLRSPA